MNQNDIERINRFVGLRSPRDNRIMIKLTLLLLILPAMTSYGNSVMLNYNLFLSRWMIFLPIDCTLIIWATYLLFTLERHQTQFLLYEGFWGLIIITELFSLGYSFGIHINHFSPVVLWILIICDIPFMLLLTLYRIKLFKGKNTAINKRRRIYPISFMLGLIFVLAPILNYILNKTGESFQYGVATLCFFLEGYGFSMNVVLGGNYFVALKYRDIIYLYRNGVLQKPRVKKGG